MREENQIHTTPISSPHGQSKGKEATESSRTACLPIESVSSNGHYIMGIGASMGGLDALERFFQNTPVDSGLTFVAVQHLSPDFKSMMPKLLARYTHIAIHCVEAAMSIEPNTIYLIPPRKNMMLLDGILSLTEQDLVGRLNLPINIFLHSLWTFLPINPAPFCAASRDICHWHDRIIYQTMKNW